MNWQLVHSDVAVTSDSSIVSKSHIVIERDGVQFELGRLDAPEVHVLGAKRVLVDTANMLRHLAHEMENKADKLY